MFGSLHISGLRNLTAWPPCQPFDTPYESWSTPCSPWDCGWGHQDSRLAESGDSESSGSSEKEIFICPGVNSNELSRFCGGHYCSLYGYKGGIASVFIPSLIIGSKGCLYTRNCTGCRAAVHIFLLKQALHLATPVGCSNPASTNAS